jgi:hypothetical protein
MTIEPIEMPEPTHTEYQGFDEWAKKFRPIKNHFSKSPNETMFETFGEEVDFVVKADNKYVWTWLQGDMSDLVCAGYHYVNRLGYYITEVPWEDDMDYALLSVEVECECYNEDGYENGEMGLADCSKCEGYGLVRTYVGE